MKHFKRLFLLSILFLSFDFSFSQDKCVKVTYQRSFNDNIDSVNFTISESSSNSSIIYFIKNDEISNSKTYIDIDNNKVFKSYKLISDEIITSESDIIFQQNWEYLNETEEILGLSCKKAKVIINSNIIEIFYLEDSKYVITPNSHFGITKGLILKTIYNGNRVEEAIKIDYSNKQQKFLPEDFGTILPASEYQKRINEMHVKTVNVFSNQRICYDPSIEVSNELITDSLLIFGNGTIICKMIDLPDSTWKYNIFVELSQYSDGDAYDRTGSVFVVPMDKELSFYDGMKNGIDCLPYFTDKKGKKHYGMLMTDNYSPPVELMRFYTSFGTRKYNYLEYGNYNWYDSIVFKHDVSHLVPLLSNKVLLGVFIGNYDKYGHIINLDIKFHPGNPDVEEQNVIPLFCTLNLMEMDGQDYPDFFDTDTLNLDFKLEHDINDAVISYISTGHGGWGGGDEFNKKPNEIQLDNSKISIIPWRYDCASYRERNPCSGNFSNGLSSSDYSRSGWCPGTITNPIEIFYPQITKGKHKLSICIPQGRKEGQSFSAWNISGILVY
ncbi:MAG: hypothetical protein LBP67_03030 [Bacteroidales bacterium]|jgi:GLPGLI family protein|nr:hypothetical protein [Bacteroidales bacterium]